MKIFTANSARCTQCQISRIEEGFLSLGHELTQNPSEADLIYQNNPWFEEIIALKEDGKLKPTAKIIFNILDLCPHCTDFPILKLMRQIEHADAVTVISETVARDCEVKLQNNIEFHVIYNPQMPVSYNKYLPKHQYKFLIIGRANDGNKRILPAVHALQFLGVEEREVAVIGGDNIGWGTYLGVVSNQTLNELYNSADFLLMPSKNEGIGLPAIEAAGCGVIPVICNDLTTREEFFPSELFPEYDYVTPSANGICMFLAKYLQNEGEMKIAKARLYAHYQNTLEEKFSGKSVAKAILDIYQIL